MNIHDARLMGCSVLMKRTKTDLVEAIALLRNEAHTYGKELPTLRAEVARLGRMLKHRDEVVADKAKLIDEWRERYEALEVLITTPDNSRTSSMEEVLRRAKRMAEAKDAFREATKLDPEYLTDEGFKELVVLPLKRLLYRYPEIISLKEMNDWLNRYRYRVVKVLWEGCR